jgi:hypothetical protein
MWQRDGPWQAPSRSCRQLVFIDAFEPIHLCVQSLQSTPLNAPSLDTHEGARASLLAWLIRLAVLNRSFVPGTSANR